MPIWYHGDGWECLRCHSCYFYRVELDRTSRGGIKWRGCHGRFKDQQSIANALCTCRGWLNAWQFPSLKKPCLKVFLKYCFGNFGGGATSILSSSKTKFQLGDTRLKWANFKSWTHSLTSPKYSGWLTDYPHLLCKMDHLNLRRVEDILSVDGE